jgi:hypothetical protein
MYTPFRLNPRIFPAVVSATVAESEATTVLCPQPLAADFVFEAGSVVSSPNAVLGKMTEPTKPAPRVAMAPIKERRSFDADPDSRFSRFFDVIPTFLPPSPIVQRRGPRFAFVPKSPASYRSHVSITEIVYLSIKIVVDRALCAWQEEREAHAAWHVPPVRRFQSRRLPPRARLFNL